MGSFADFLPEVYRIPTKSVCSLKSRALMRYFVYTRLVYRGWSPPYNRLGQADDSYATTAVAVGLSLGWRNQVTADM
jgi:hypothetical protein